MTLKKFKKSAIWACSGLLVSLFSGLIPLNDNLCNLNTSTVVYAERRVFNDKCINSTIYNKETKTLTIPDGFTEIRLFNPKDRYPDLETVNIPASVEIIGAGVFCDCAKLTKVNIAPGSKLKIIEMAAFELCSSLKTINLPESVEKIGRSVFHGCSSLENINIPNNVHTIGEMAFKDCTALETIFIPGSCKKIGKDCFEGCKIKILTNDIALKLIADPKFFHDGVFDLSSTDFEYMVPHVFDGGSFYKMETLKLPGKLKEIRESLCEYELPIIHRKYNLKQVVIPASVTKIGRKAFYGMGIEQVTIVDDDITPSQLEFIEDEAFGNTSLKNISIPKKCKLGKRCFLNSDLESAIVPFDIDSLPESTFDACSSLKKVTIPTAVKSIEKRALYSCHNLKHIDFIDPEKDIITRCNLENFEIPQHIVCMGENSFGNNFIIRSIKLPPNLHTVEKATFQGCENLEKVECNKELEEIEESAFWGSGLRHFTAPEKVNSIKKDAFGECVKLGSIEALGEEISLGENCCDCCLSLRLMSFPNANIVTVDKSLGGDINENFALFMPSKPSQSQLIVKK